MSTINSSAVVFTHDSTWSQSKLDFDVIGDLVLIAHMSNRISVALQLCFVQLQLLDPSSSTDEP